MYSSVYKNFLKLLFLVRRAPLFRPAGLVDLTLARDGEGIGGHLVGDGGAGGDVAAVSDRDGGDEVCVAADEGVVANRAAELFEAVVVRRDRAAAEVDALAAIAVADVGEVRDCLLYTSPSPRDTR